jgi:hypothetical protein
METELRSVNIPLHRFLTNEIVTELDVKKSLKISDNEIAQIVGKAVCSNDNLDELIKEKEKERLAILADLEILTAVDYIETKM